MVATIALDVSTGPVGTVVEITGTDFTPAATVTFTFDGNPIVANDAPITVAGGGTFTAHITIPASTSGAKAIVADDGTVNDSENFTVESKITLSVSSGDYGDSVTVTGTGFGNAQAVTIEFNSVDVTGAALSTNATGGFSRAITVPDAPFGARTITATDAALNTDSETFTVAALIVLDDASGSIGETLVVAGHGFTASSAVSFTFGGASITPSNAPITSAADGSFSANLVIPSGYDGNVTVVATDAATRTDSDTFRVILVSSTQATVVTAFAHLNGRNLSLGSVNEIGTRESGATIDVAFHADDRYSTGGIQVDFTGAGFSTVYLCKIIHNTVGLECSFVPGASNSASLGKIKFWGTDGNELADNSSAIASKTLRVFVRGRAR